MLDGDEFRAAIEEEKKRARREHGKTRAESWGGKDEPGSPMNTDIQSIQPFSAIPGLGSAKPAPDISSDDSPWGVPEVEKMDEDVISPTLSTDGRTSGQPFSYAGLVSARKRKHDDSATKIKGMPPSRRTSMASRSDGFGDAEGDQKRPFAPPKKPARGLRPAYDDIKPIDTRTTSRSSDWFDTIDMKEKFSRGDLHTLQYINTLIKQCQDEAGRSGNLEPIFAKVRQRLHKMEFFDFLRPVIVKKSKVLDDNVGLPQIFNDGGGVQYPWDIKDDAQMLYTRWMQGLLDPGLLRGIESVRRQRAAGRSGVSHKLERDYPHRVSCNVVGDNRLQNGQWWPMQICAMRDGAHGEIEAGIHGQPGRGAFSVILSGGGYDDLDEGDKIWYCGTSGSEGKPTAGTSHLKESHRLKQPVRVLRSSALPASNQYRPSKGLRYDGLYDVVDCEILDAATAMHRFSLKRRENQHPIRYHGEEARPTAEERLEYNKIRDLLGISAA